MAKSVTPDDVLSFTAPTDGYLCKASANVYGIDFIYFRIRDMDSQKVVFEIRKPEPPAGHVYAEPDDNDDSWSLEFKVGSQPVPNFRMIERHYFRGKLIQNYDFGFGFCIPNSVNTWEAIYPMPRLPKETIAAMIANPFETKSDSFYFVNDELIMHNKAEYCYQ